MKKRYAGGWVDERVDDGAVEIINALPGDPEILRERIAVLLGGYRDWLKVRESTPTPAAVRKHLEKTTNQSHRLARYLVELPVEVDRAAQQHGTIVTHDGKPPSLEQMAQHLRRQGQIFDAWAADLQGSAGREGKPPRTLEHKLLSDTAYYLEKIAGQNRTSAANKAVDILTLCDVPHLPKSETAVPSGDRQDQPLRTINGYRKEHPEFPPGL